MLPSAGWGIFVAISALWKWLALAKNPATAAPAVSAAPLRAKSLLVRPPADFPAVPWDMNRSPEPLENHLIPVSKGSDGP